MLCVAPLVTLTQQAGRNTAAGVSCQASGAVPKELGDWFGVGSLPSSQRVKEQGRNLLRGVGEDAVGPQLFPLIISSTRARDKECSTCQPMVTAVVMACPRRSDRWNWGWIGLPLGVTQDPRTSLHGPRPSLLLRLAVPSQFGFSVVN